MEIAVQREWFRLACCGYFSADRWQSPNVDSSLFASWWSRHSGHGQVLTTVEVGWGAREAVMVSRAKRTDASRSDSSLSSYCPHPAFAVDNGDVLIQSSDSVLFGVHSCILTMASPVFRESLPLPPPSATSESILVRQPLVLTEPAHVLDLLLRIIYPVPTPTLDNLSVLAKVLAASIEYDISVATTTLRKQLISPSFLSSEPLRVFAIACRFGFKEEATEASNATLSMNIVDAPLVEELRYVSAYDYHRLLSFHRTRSRAARNVVGLRGKSCPARCMGCSYNDPGGQASLPRWWYSFEKRAKEELERRPLTDIIFSMRFLSECEGCPSCGGNMLDSFHFLEGLKAELDALPDRIAD